MKNYEKNSFIKIFLGYFIPVNIFILLLGFFYFQQQQTFVMQTSAMNMHQYLLKARQSNFTYKQDGYAVIIVKNTEVKKQLPVRVNDKYTKAFSSKFIVSLDAKIIDNQLKNIKYITIASQILMIVFFTFISWILAKKSIKPMMDTISHLDRFTKDLIHDLNTPITSILLNTNMLKKNASDDSIKKITRIENSAKSISSLYSNLELILDENTVETNVFNLANIVDELVDTYKLIYPNIEFTFINKTVNINSNKDALKRILDNIISNACKYSTDIKPTIYIEYTNNIITIKDNGKGIKYPKKIFERSYKEDDNGHGIGMHIVHRLCSELAIKIDIVSKENYGTTVVLTLH